MSRLPWLMALALGGASLIGCNKSVECGAGTVEMNGVCTFDNGMTPGGNCGGGTRYDSVSGECRPDLYADDGGLPAYCGANTAVVVNDAGLQICVGTGEGGNCEDPVSCPAPTGMNKISVCGRIYDTQTTQPIDDGTGTVSAGIEVRLYDPLGFVADPVGTMPLSIVYTDDCGRFKAPDVTRPFNGFIAAATEDIAGSPADVYWLTGVATAAAAGQTINNLNTFATRKETDAMWTVSAGLTGATFAERGVYVPMFLDPLGTHLEPLEGEPVAGVQTTQGGSTDATKDYYFSDADPLTRGTIDPGLTVTGVNGSGLWINGMLIQFSGVGAEPTGCTWPMTLAATPAGVVFVQERIATGGPCGM